MIGPVTAFGVYIIVWWMTLFAVLPLGRRPETEAERAELPPGCDAGAPVRHDMKRKLLTTTWVAAIVWAVILLVIWTGVMPLPEFPGRS